MKNLIDMISEAAPKYEFEDRPLYEIAAEIKKCWKPKVHPYAKDYLDAMMSLDSINDKYGMDSGRSIVAYFLANASQFKGDDAKRLKAELKALLNKKK